MRNHSIYFPYFLRLLINIPHYHLIISLCFTLSFLTTTLLIFSLVLFLLIVQSFAYFHFFFISHNDNAPLQRDFCYTVFNSFKLQSRPFFCIFICTDFSSLLASVQLFHNCVCEFVFVSGWTEIHVIPLVIVFHDFIGYETWSINEWNN